jgi:hypothetical protein
MRLEEKARDTARNGDIHCDSKRQWLLNEIACIVFSENTPH